MMSTLMLFQFASQNIALLCCALFAGGATYVSLAEHPAIDEGGTAFAGAYLLAAHPRSTVIQCAFAVVGALSGAIAGLAGGGLWWLVGAFVLGVAALILLFVVQPATRHFLEIDPKLDAERASQQFVKLARLQAALSLASLVALSVFIWKT